MADDYGDGLAFIIRELTGQKRTLRLTGRGLPYRNLKLGTRQRANVEWNPGAPFGTGTVLGPVEDDTSINGIWKDKYVAIDQSLLGVRGINAPILLDGEPFGSVADIERVADSFCREGQLVEVTWGPVIRHGIWTGWDREWITIHDLQWTITFKWISRGEEVDPVVFVSTLGFDSVSGAMSGLLDDFAAITTDGLGIFGGVLETLQGFQQGIEDAIQSVKDTVQGLVNGVSSVIQAARGIAATFEGLINDCTDFIAWVESRFGTTPGLNTGPASGGAAWLVNTDYPSQTEAQKLKQLVLMTNLKQWAFKVKWAAARQKAQIKTAVGGNVVAQIVLRQGTDLRDVSREYYGTPFEWRRIALFNELDGVDPDPGAVIFVPKVNPQEAGRSCPDA